MCKEELTELLKNFLSYRYAIQRYERHRPQPSAGIANYSGISGGSGAPERFFATVGKPADMGFTSLQDALDYQAYTSIVTEIEGALSTLTDDERSVIVSKWMRDMTLKQISVTKGMSIDTVKKLHKRALAKLTISMRFANVVIPEIATINLSTARYKEVSTF